MSGLGSICKSMPEQSLIHEQEVQANMRSLQQPRGQPSQPGKDAFGLKCYRCRPQPRSLFLVRDGVSSQPIFDKIKNTYSDEIECFLFLGQFKAFFYDCCPKVEFEIGSYFCQSNRLFMSKKCKQTCGLCNSLEDNLPSLERMPSASSAIVVGLNLGHCFWLGMGFLVSRFLTK